MNCVTVSLLLALFLGTGSCQEPDVGSTDEDCLEAIERPYPVQFEMKCPDPEEDESTRLCSNDTEGILITLPRHCGPDQTCSRYRLFACPQTFDNALCQCRAIGGKLVTIANAVENQQIQQAVCYQNRQVGQVWIGLKKACGAYHYTYIDGTTCQYRNWACGQPERQRNMCAALCAQTGKWRSLHCSTRVPFLCKL